MHSRSYKLAYPKAYGCDTGFGDLSERGGLPPWDMEQGFQWGELCKIKKIFLHYTVLKL